MSIDEKTGKKSTVNSFERVCLKTGKNESLPSFSSARCGHFSWVDFASKKIYIACGANKLEGLKAIASIEVYDIGTKMWT